MSFHQNLHGDCPGCEHLFDRYPGFDAPLRLWFGTVRRAFFDAHISCAGRGKIEQEVDFQRGASNAHWGQSAHNYNAAIDLFQQDMNAPHHYSVTRDWVLSIFDKCPLPADFEWYGAPGEKYREVPHIQVRNWRELVVPNSLRLVEAA